MYIHMARGLYYGSYRNPRTMVWNIGVVIFLIMIITAFLGYVLPMGMMSYWGATVITNLLSAIPVLGNDIVTLLWGGFSVNNATLNRFFSLHYLLPFAIAALVVMHLIALHQHGSGNPNGYTGNIDRVAFHPYFSFKDLVTGFFILNNSFWICVFCSQCFRSWTNYEMANPMSTPSSIVPEWYLLPYYAILRSIPNKLLGVIAMIAAILILFSLPLVDLSRIRGNSFRPLGKLNFWIFIVVFIVLMGLGANHPESPFVELGQVCTLLYFGYFV
ncbi:apocytochrome b, partial (mitochondrion) [Neolecta irregularis DAH-3]